MQQGTLDVEEKRHKPLSRQALSSQYFSGSGAQILNQCESYKCMSCFSMLRTVLCPEATKQTKCNMLIIWRNNQWCTTIHANYRKHFPNFNCARNCGYIEDNNKTAFSTKYSKYKQFVTLHDAFYAKKDGVNILFQTHNHWFRTVLILPFDLKRNKYLDMVYITDAGFIKPYSCINNR